ncbi:hypothetical protein MUO14_17350 [Halobacillus shinanisalinarum]|uniref:Uncharacterized protein n=1 Tax=Halobacillus shinanisalinarum TaxID=2932258 RepID=A0ABY4GWE9_9BACI|nr:hypothetical protein [Halobacillus shinanisalinarum]UOQ92235.1 hypothetical protein MUO14_17350 [Halobacillus shinanisalinarum]
MIIIQRRTTTLIVITSLFLAFLFIHTSSANGINVFKDETSSNQLTKAHEESKVSVKGVSNKTEIAEIKADLTRPMLKYPKTEIISFQAWDDSGNMLAPTDSESSSRSKNNKIVHQVKMSFEKNLGKTEYLTIKPVIKKVNFEKMDDKSSGKEVNTVGKIPVDQRVSKMANGDLPIVLDQGEMGKVYIADIERLSNKTVIHVQAKGIDPIQQVNEIWLQDQSGKDYLRYSKPKLNPEKNEYTIEFPSVDNKFKVITTQLEAPNVFEDLAIKVPLN